jgi:hypothetical protein
MVTVSVTFDRFISFPAGDENDPEIKKAIVFDPLDARMLYILRGISTDFKEIVEILFSGLLIGIVMS